MAVSNSSGRFGAGLGLRQFIIASMSLLTTGVRGSLVFVAAAAVTAVFSINFCGWIFGCGCHSWWAGASATCNIHMQGARHCPWCIDGGQGFRVAFIVTLAAQAAVSFLPAKLGWQYRLLVALGAFPLVGALVAWVYGSISHYWS
jgi:hypothetical protein